MRTVWQTGIRSVTALKVFIFSAVFIISSLVPMLASPPTTKADTSNCDGNGVALSSSSWLTGTGITAVNVCNHPGNGSHYCLTISGDPTGQNCPAGQVWSGDEWQCVELVNRLYLTNRWTNATWYGDGGGNNSISNSNNLPSGLTAEAQGAISYINPGDVVSLNNTNDPAGHAGVFDHTSLSGNTTEYNLINQNTQQINSSMYMDSGSFSSKNAHFTMNPWPGYTIRAIVHHPAIHKVPGDWDNDGLTNPAVFRPSDGTWHWRTPAGGDATQQFGQSGDIPVPGYYSGSAVPDYAVYRPSNETWYVRTQAGAIFNPQSFGLPGDIPVPGDYNGDGKTDFAVFRPSDDTWHYYQGGADITTSFGSPGDIPAPAYWDGGSKTEPGVFRPSDGTWHYLSGGEVIQQFGQNGDIPEPAYFSGSSKPDYGLYRPSSNTWYWLPQGGSQNIRPYGATGDIPTPGNFDNRTNTQNAIFRPSNDTWHYYNGSDATVGFGLPGDIPAIATLPYPILHSLGLL